MAKTQLIHSVAIAVAFLAAVSWASTQGPAMAPTQHSAPMHPVAPVPVQHVAAPPPIQQVEPAPPVESPEGVPGPASNDCITAVTNLTGCLSYVSAGSTVTTPDKECCPALAGLLDSNPICLCQLFGSAKNYGIDIDINRALKLPSVCKLTTPPLSTCALLGIPVPAPTSADSGLVMPGAPSMSPSSPISAPPESNEAHSCYRISALLFFIGLSGAAAVIF